MQRVAHSVLILGLAVTSGCGERAQLVPAQKLPFDSEAAAPGTTFSLPAGRYGLDRPIVLRSGQQIWGSRIGRTILQPNEGFQGIALVINEPQASDFELHNLALQGNGQKTSGAALSGVHFNAARRIGVDACTFSETSGHGISIGDKTSDVKITGCKFSHCGRVDSAFHGIQVASEVSQPDFTNTLPSTTHGVEISGCSVNFSGTSGVLLFNVSDVVIKQCFISDSMAARGILVGPTSSNVRILNNYVTRSKSTGIHVYGSSDVTIDSNVASQTVSDGSGRGQEGQGIKTYVHCKNITIRNNICTENFSDGIAVLSGVDGATIEDNLTVRNKRYGVYVISGAPDEWTGFPGGATNNITLGRNVSDSDILGSEMTRDYLRKGIKIRRTIKK